VLRLPVVARRSATLWARGRADRRIAARLALRQLLDRAGARWLPRGVDAVYATSFCGRRTFAAAKRRDPSIECHLVEDLADLRQLHADLDLAARAHPDSTFLNRHRATPQQLATQQAERVLADVLHVRSRFAEGLRLAEVRAASHVRLLRPAAVGSSERRRGTSDQPALLLAGLATARSGTYEALAMIDAIPDATLVVQVGEGLEPGDLLRHPRVRPIPHGPGPALDDIDIVIAPSWCEADLPEIASAVDIGTPVIATLRAAGTVELACTIVEPGDTEGLIRAVRLQLER
jgi:RES domain-containing protein